MNKIIIIIGIAVFIIAIVLAPIEAKILNQTVRWMYFINIFEVCIFEGGLLAGYNLGKTPIGKDELLH